MEQSRIKRNLLKMCELLVAEDHVVQVRKSPGPRLRLRPFAALVGVFPQAARRQTTHRGGGVSRGVCRSASWRRATRRNWPACRSAWSSSWRTTSSHRCVQLHHTHSVASRRCVRLHHTHSVASRRCVTVRHLVRHCATASLGHSPFTASRSDRYISRAMGEVSLPCHANCLPLPPGRLAQLPLDSLP